MQAAVALPVGVLAGLSVLMFVFMFWWFPRHYQKGVRMDMAEVDEARRQREMEEAHGVAVVTADGQRVEGQISRDAHEIKAPPRGYIPPVTPY